AMRAEARLLAEAGCAALLVTLRAHGDSTGHLNDFGRGSAADVVAAVDWIERHRPGRRVLVWGQSLGSAAALFAAGTLGGRVSGYVLECPYRDLDTAVRNRAAVYLPFGVRTVAAAGLTAVAPLVLADARASPLRAASQMPPSARVLILAGSADRRATPDEARAIHGRIPGSRLVVIDGGDHLELAAADPAGYAAAVNGFLGE
ncbi:MAG: alpha/beta hydrolase, partial [Gemmataceae bacterium]